MVNVRKRGNVYEYNFYVLNDKYKIEISEVKITLNEIINNKNII